MGVQVSSSHCFPRGLGAYINVGPDLNRLSLDIASGLRIVVHFYGLVTSMDLHGLAAYMAPIRVNLRGWETYMAPS